MSAESAGRVLDVLVVGGGPAGLAVAIAARAHGLEAAVLDRREPPIDKPCGEGLMPDALSSLEQLGVPLARLRHRPFVGIRYLDGEVVAEGRFPGRPGAGVRRPALHAALIERAETVGVDLRWQTPVDGLWHDGGRGGRWRGVETAGHGRVAARFVVAADGLRSPLRRAAGLGGRPVRRRAERFGVRRHYAMAPWCDRVEVYWADGCEAYVTPVADEEVGVAMLWQRGMTGGFDRLLTAFPRLERRLAGVTASSRDLGCGPLRQHARAVVRANLALVGDASGYVDAITGEGMALAFHQALALAEAIAGGDLRRYAVAHRRIGLLPDRMTRTVLWLERRPWLRRRAIRALAAEPEAFSRLLAVHTRAVPFAEAGARAAPRLLWRMLQPART